MRYKVIISVVIVTLAILSAVGIYQFKRADDLALAVENQYTHAFREMTEYVQDVDVLLKKSMLASSPAHMSSIASEIFMQTAAAKANLGLLPVADPELSGTAKFLSQVGDYTSYLSAKVINEGEITEEEYASLEKLSEYAGKVSHQLEALEDKVNSGELNFSEKSSSGAAFAEEENSFGSAFRELEKSFQDYPSLIYDGPFSEHIETIGPVMIENRPAFNQEEARKVAASFLEGKRSEQLVFVDESGGSIPTYNFRASLENSRVVTVSVTKQGGYVLYMLDNRDITEKKLSVSQAMERARVFLQRQGFYNMKASYYEENSNMATINFAATQDDAVLYSDLIKVKVALDNGEVIGYESKGYIMSHKTRELPTEILTEEEAKKEVSSHLAIDSVQLAVIPLSSKREVLCYEFKGTCRDSNFLIYINAETGREEEILMLIESESGILTV
ncbi:MAG: germination protein YpeB [Clostridia bacterium]|nr:germination protein YpeB [Clostridia bacterium]